MATISVKSARFPRYVHIALLCALVLMSAGKTAAEDACASCTENPQFPDAAQFLESQGYSIDEYTVLLTWDEAAPADRTQRIHGYHVARKAGSRTFDLYSDSQGQLLDSAHLRALGIRQKRWDLKPMQHSAETPVSGPAAALARPLPAGAKYGVTPTETLELPPVDVQAALSEDAAGLSSPGKGVTRIGVFQVFAAPVVLTGASASAGAWTTLPDGGRLWSLTIHSPDAIGQRVHFSALQVPSPCSVLVYNAGDPSEVYGPYSAPPAGEIELWSATCFSESVVVECQAPAGIDLSTLTVRIERVIHIYKGFDSLPWAKSPAGACNLDVSCYDDWSATARGVGGIGSVSQSGFLWCTGSLLVDTDPITSIPYFLTAHHCVGGQVGSRGASSIEVYWLYQTPACNSGAPNPATVPRTIGGADYLAGATGIYEGGIGNDFTLLRLRNAPPSGLTYLGWSTLAPAFGSPITCIHHPHGDFKRISFGVLSDNVTPQPNAYPALYHEVSYNSGTTEPGSSGCPLMLTSTHQIIGQLWGGDASCALPLSPDFYGRFDVTFPLVSSYLAPSTEIPSVDFSAPGYSVNEAETFVVITVQLNMMPGGTPASVNYATSDASAASGLDYEATNGTLTFDGTEKVRTFTVTIHNHPTGFLYKSLYLTLSDPVGCTLAGMDNPATLTIVRNNPQELSALSVPIFR